MLDCEYSMNLTPYLMNDNQLDDGGTMHVTKIEMLWLIYKF